MAETSRLRSFLFLHVGIPHDLARQADKVVAALDALAPDRRNVLPYPIKRII